ncbi:amidohydrolase family protein [Paenibacillus koleovorans]|uniref:amidohydrolase family protein n=1 Tax=Paenibacillus koleovorans TaxID=121608 RepID=UPI000FD90CF4|nr:amidohydrolase family protein [Paenibacillus koleovorans]
MIIDMHTHIWHGRYEQHARDLVTNCERYGIDKVFVSGLQTQYSTKEQVKGQNADVARFLKEHRDVAEGYVYVNPTHDDAMDVLRRGIEETGMIGLKLWIATYCTHQSVFPLIEKCIEYDIPILLHAFYKAINQLPDETTGPHVAELAQRYPQAKLIMAHFGGNHYHGLKAIRDYPNVVTDFSGSIFRREEVDYAVKMLGAERILFGSDMPGCSYITNFGQVEEADLTEEERSLIYSGNTIKLFNLKYAS